MNNSRELAVTITGAVIGGATAYLLFTERGRRRRRQIEAALEDFSREVTSLRHTMQEAAGAANAGWQLLNDTLDAGRKPPAPYSSGQTSPF